MSGDTHFMSNFRPLPGVTWNPRRHRLIGVTWATAAALMATTLVPSEPIDNGAPAEPVLQLLNSTWDDAEPLKIDAIMVENSVVDPEIADAEVELVLDDATNELGEVTDLLDDTVTQVVAGSAYTDAPTVEEDALITSLDEVESVLAEAEQVFSQPGTASDAEINSVEADLAEVLEDTDAALEAAIDDASAEELIELEQAEEALDTAVAAITEAGEVDAGIVTDLGGWVPNLRYAIDRRGPQRELSGQGIDIAVIDSGITPVAGLDGDDKVINGPDLSADGGNPDLSSLDLYGHGTHLAGIIAGNDGGTPEPGQPHFTGIAPDARLVNVKVADAEGNTSVEQLVAAIEWVILNKETNGMNIRVLNLAFGFDGDDMEDPIAAALEEAWDAGIVVVVAGGNQGNDSNGLDNPAVDPYVLAVAGSDQMVPTTFDDDTIAPWSSSGDGTRNPDLAAPGRSVVSLRVPGSYADVHYPESRIDGRFAVASGTSQSSAVMAGAVALLLEKDPTLSPDQVKNLFMDSARNVISGQRLDGQGTVRLNRALWRLRTDREGPVFQQYHTRLPMAPGFGTDLGGWSGGSWSGGSWSGAGWSGGSWSGGSWSGAGWSGGSWSGGSWSGAGWSGAGWSGGSWSGAGWSGAGWSGAGWSGASWSGAGWSGASWS